MKTILKDKRFILLLVSLSILLLTVAGFLYWKKSTYDPDKYNTYLKEAEKLQEDMQYAAALDKYLLAVDTAPREYPAYEGVVTILALKNRFEDASSVIEQVELNLEPVKLGELYVITGNAKYEQGLYDDAYYDLKEAYDLTNSSELLTILVDSGLKSGTEDNLSPYITLLPADALPRQSLDKFDELSGEEAKLFDLVKGAKELLENGYPKLAIELLEPKSDGMAEYWDGKYLLGRAYYEAGDYGKAVGLFEDSVTLGADDPTLYWYLARTQDKLDKPSESYKYYDRAILLAEDDKVEPIFNEYVEILISDKQYSKALDITEMFVDKDFGMLAMIDLYIAQDQSEKLETLLGEYEPTDDYKEDYLRTLINYHEKNDQLDKVTPLVDQLKTQTEDQAYLVYCEGLSAEAMGESTTASEKYKRAIDIDTVGEVTTLASERLTSLDKAE